MQSAKGKTKTWKIDWDVLPGVGRWENDLMGWGSSADYVQGTELKFKTSEDAVNFVSCLDPLLDR
jgi:NADH dehydrogenase (ubiquinone) Fe-S protein 4